MKILVSETHVQPDGLCKEAAERSCRPTGEDVFSHSADFVFSSWFCKSLRIASLSYFRSEVRVFMDSSVTPQIGNGIVSCYHHLSSACGCDRPWLTLPSLGES